MNVHELEFDVLVESTYAGLTNQLSEAAKRQVKKDEIPIRFVVSAMKDKHLHCELGVLAGTGGEIERRSDSIFSFEKRGSENTSQFTSVVVIPTGIGAEIGGHAGDAGPVVKMFSEICDRVITHPNAVNASDINEIPENALYVEGSVLSRLLMGTVGLQPARGNRVLAIIDGHRDSTFCNAAVNSVSAARAAYGLNCPEVVVLDPPVLLSAEYSSTGRARGKVEDLDGLLSAFRAYEGRFDAVALSSVIRVPKSFHMDYFLSDGHMVNPWGGVEAMLTHSLSHLFNIPTAHSPMFESQEIANMDPGIVEPRMAAEAVSLTFLQCILKGLSKSPKIINDPKSIQSPGVLSVSDVSCLVIPEGCLGLPTLAALEQGIPVIAVKENKNLMKNNLELLPWRSDQYYVAENYWEAAGIVACLKSGVSPASVRRPVSGTIVTMHSCSTSMAKSSKSVLSGDQTLLAGS